MVKCEALKSKCVNILGRTYYQALKPARYSKIKGLGMHRFLQIECKLCTNCSLSNTL
jgi:hypothetical protein